jgi:hypothetical protein
MTMGFIGLPNINITKNSAAAAIDKTFKKERTEKVARNKKSAP